VRKESETAKVHLSEVAAIILQTRQVNISAYLLSELSKQKIALIVTDEASNPIGEYLPLYGSHNCSKRILEQISWTEPSKKRVWQRIVKDKIMQQAQLLDRRGSEDEAKSLFDMVADVKSGDTTGREAAAARYYFSTLFGRDFNRDADIPLNAALNYGYAILLSMTNREIVSRGYLTQLGIWHHSEYNQFNFASDLMEPFRPVVDMIVLDFFDGFFDQEIKRLLGNLANRNIEYKGGTYRMSSVLSLYVQDCLDALNKKESASEIEGFSVK
jgi:CRISPR-associated protein Cas1